MRTEDFEGFRVTVVDGFTLPCNRFIIQQLELTLGGHKMCDDFYVIGIGDTELVLGVQWLHSQGEYTQNYRTLELKFK